MGKVERGELRSDGFKTKVCFQSHTDGRITRELNISMSGEESGFRRGCYCNHFRVLYGFAFFAVSIVLRLGRLRLDHEYETEYEYDFRFSNQ